MGHILFIPLLLRTLNLLIKHMILLTILQQQLPPLLLFQVILHIRVGVQMSILNGLVDVLMCH